MIHSCYFNIIQQQQVGQLCVQNWKQLRDFLMWQLPLCGTGCTHHIKISIIPQSMVMQISQMLWMSFKTSFQNWLGHLGQLMNRLSFRCVVHNRVMLTNNRCGASATSFAGKIPPIMHVVPRMEWLDFQCCHTHMVQRILNQLWMLDVRRHIKLQNVWKNNCVISMMEYVFTTTMMLTYCRMQSVSILDVEEEEQLPAPLYTFHQSSLLSRERDSILHNRSSLRSSFQLLLIIGTLLDWTTGLQQWFITLEARLASGTLCINSTTTWLAGVAFVCVERIGIDMMDWMLVAS